MIYKNGKGHLSFLCYRFNNFYGYRDEDIHVDAGMGKEKELFWGRVIVLLLLFWTLDRFFIDRDIPTKTFCVMVVVGLFFNSIGDCLDKRIPISFDVLADG